MKAVVHDRYGPPEVLRIEDVPKPVPAPDEVLVRVRATGVTRSDAHLRAGQPFVSRFMSGPLRPKRRILGHELAGEVDAVGAEVAEFAVGDHVFGALPYLALRTGAHAEYISVPQRFPLAPMPAGTTFEEAGGVGDGALLTMNALRPLGPLEGRGILVYGASGSMGTAGVQLSKHFGAHVTAVCNTKNVELVRSLGADEVIDYLHEDFTKNGETYHVLFDAVGKLSFRRCKRSLTPGGVFVPTDGLRNIALWLLHKRFGDRKVVFELPPRMRKEDVVFLKGLIEAGEYRPVIDRTYPLESAVEAHRYVETRQKVGNVVLTLNGGSSS
ncbi:MAG TPA: NAD(P)-dependent alcohol dehydrogenase [Gaiellaceae bacterium]|nr:NAD(P)-dependent alcohol dehydrogenase [Gaiellaceae bacterium]